MLPPAPPRTIVPPTSHVAPAPPPAAPGPGANASVEELCGAARVAANAGRYEEAVALCRRAVAADAVNVEAYILWAHVTDEQGHAAEAKNLWKKVIYLAPSQTEAYVELGALYEREGDLRRSRQMRETALALVRGAGAQDAQRAPQDMAQLEALTRHLEELLAAGAGTGQRAAAHRPPVHGRRA
jgi:tetratricopeptide (TPR) repeat protein